MNETKKKIYMAAKEQFYEKGYYDTTVREIAKGADVNYGLFTYYFQNKYNLARQIYFGLLSLQSGRQRIKNLIVHHPRN